MEMACKTPKLTLPSVKDFGNFTAEYQFGFVLDGYQEYQQVTEETHNISIEVTVIKLSNIEEHDWLPYDSSSGEPLDLKVFVT